MLSAKPWKLEAILRLLLSVFVCVYAVSVLAGVSRQHWPGGERPDSRLVASKLRFVDANDRAFHQKIISPHQHAANQGYVNGLALLSIAAPVLPLALVSLACLGATLFLVRKPWPQQWLGRRLAALFFCFYGGLFLGAWALELAGPGAREDPVAQMIIGTLSFQGAALVLVARFVREHQLSWVEAFGFSNRRLQAVLIGIIFACVFLPVGQRLQRVSIILMDRLSHSHFKPEEQQAVQTLHSAVSSLDWIGLGLVTILLAPAAEETLFRGILYPWIKKLGFPRLALWVTSLLFAAIHLNVAAFLPLFVLAMALAVLYEKTNNLLGCITAHAFFNAFNFALEYLKQKGFAGL